MTTSFFIYHFQVSLAVGLFYLFYMALLRKNTFFVFRRVWLLLGLLFCLLYPFIELPSFTVPSSKLPIFQVSLPALDVDTESKAMERETNYWPLVYGAVVIFMFLRLCLAIFSLFSLTRRGKKISKGNYCLSLVDEAFAPFCFGKTVYISKGQYNKGSMEDIIKHESTHAVQLHTFDIMMAELFVAFFWYNPFVWLYRRCITHNLEYLADAGALAQSANKKEYQTTLLHFVAPHFKNKLVHSFNVSQLKKRIMMMNQKKSSYVSLLRYALVIPFAITLHFVACSDSGQEFPTKTIEKVVEKVEATPTEEVVVTEKTPVRTVEQDSVYRIVDVEPEFPGGTPSLLKFISSNIIYPEEAKKKGIHGRVIACFTVEKDGSVTDVTVVRGIAESLDNEAVRVLSSLPKWKPGTHNGKPARVLFTIPVNFLPQEK